jgi:putative intracellular protease/amidase
MFDLPNNNALQQLIAKVYQQQGVIAAVCHGPAALVNVKLDNGNYLVAGKQVSAMTNIEEKLFAKNGCSSLSLCWRTNSSNVAATFNPAR